MIIVLKRAISKMSDVIVFDHFTHFLSKHHVFFSHLFRLGHLYCSVCNYFQNIWGSVCLSQVLLNLDLICLYRQSFL